MKWVKASERLPDKKGRYLCKYDGENECIQFDGVSFVFSYGNALSDKKLEWLDEIQPEQTRGQEEDEVVGTFTFDHEKGEEKYTPNPNFGKPVSSEEGVKRFYAVEYSGFFNIQTSPDYGGKNILDAESIGYKEAGEFANLIAELLNKHYGTVK